NSIFRISTVALKRSVCSSRSCKPNLTPDAVILNAEGGLARNVREKLYRRKAAMKLMSVLLVMVFALAAVIWAQSRRLQATAHGNSEGELRADHCQEVMQAHRQEIEARKADRDKMRSYLAQMKANLLTLTRRDELDR